MSDWRNSFDKIRSGAIDKVKNNVTEDTPIKEAKENIDKARKVVQNTQRITAFVGKIVSTVFNSLLFLITTPFGWAIDIVVILVIVLLMLNQTVGQADFSTQCPIDPATGKAYVLTEEKGKDKEKNKDEKSSDSSSSNSNTSIYKGCKVYGAGKGKGRTSGGDEGSSGEDGTASGKGIEVLDKHLNQQWDLDGAYGGQCWDLTRGYVKAVSGKDVVIGGSGKAAYIGHDFKSQLEGAGFQVLLNPSWSDIKPGDVFNTLGGITDGFYGHTGVVKSVNGDKIVTYEQNAEKGQIVALYNRSVSAYKSSGTKLMSIVRYKK